MDMKSPPLGLVFPALISEYIARDTKSRVARSAFGSYFGMKRSIAPFSR